MKTLELVNISGKIKRKIKATIFFSQHALPVTTNKSENKGKKEVNTLCIGMEGLKYGL